LPCARHSGHTVRSRYSDWTWLKATSGGTKLIQKPTKEFPQRM
jgi:hypothetical protein